MHVVQVAFPETLRDGSMMGARALPPTNWWRWGEGTTPGVTRLEEYSYYVLERMGLGGTYGSMRWMLSSEQENRRKSLNEGPPGIGLDVFCALANVAMSATRTMPIVDCMFVDWPSDRTGDKTRRSQSNV